jgi:acyl-CoA reductase-like NAD-dependent aldehyde dehydrogenase
MRWHRETIASAAERLVDSVNPATGAVRARIAATPLAAVPDLFRRSRAAQAEWAARSLRERSNVLRDLQGRIFDAREPIVDTISQETGKPRVEAIFAELALSLDTAGFLARQARRWLRAEHVPHHNLALKAKSGWIEYEPHGIVTVISPWNYPFAIPISQAMAAVVAGNAVLLKPSELAPATGALVGELFRRAGCPEGVVEVVQGAGEIGAALVDAGPDKVFFTGSVATGKQIAEACARKLIPSVLELGGKDAMIVLADADLDVASSAAVWGGFTNCGQACLSVERIYVEEPIANRFTELCVEKTRKLRLGPFSDRDADIGPMIHLRQLERVEEQLRDATARGAKILTGGRRRADLGPAFLEPAVVVNVDHSMRLMREETFGPVIAIRAVASAEEACQMANDSSFALSASVWTRDSAQAKRIASRLRAGSVMINDVASYYGITEAPHGGRGDSGWGRSHSRLGLLEMVQVKYVDVDRLPGLPKSWWFGYGGELAASAGRFVEAMFARRWSQRVRALAGRRGARGVVFRGHRV